MKKSDVELPLESPIPFRTGSNGEFVPRPPTARDERAEQLFREVVDDRSRRLGVSRRAFIGSAAGTAAALFVINQVYGCGGGDGGADGGADAAGGDAGYTVDAAMTIDADQACDVVSGDELIVDVQTHHVNPTGPWRDSNPSLEALLSFLPQANCGDPDPVACYSLEHYVRELFVNSDTSVAVLSALPAADADNGLTPDEAAESRAIINTLAGSKRLLIHGMVLPDLGQAQIDGMQRLAEEVRIEAWKVYTSVGEYWLDDEATGIVMIEKARELGIDIICAHKGLTLPGFNQAYSSPRDVGVVAPAYPDMRFVVYHSAFEQGPTEGPYNPDFIQGTDQLVKAMLDAELPPNSNVYAELGSTWRSVMTSPTEAAHVIGKMLLYVGEDRVLWGTDSIWYGSPQDQIAAFRAFEIPVSMQETYGYPALTPERKAKILGLNAAALYGLDPDATLCAIDDDDIARTKRASVDRPRATFNQYGPQTRRELFGLLKMHGGKPL